MIRSRPSLPTGATANDGQDDIVGWSDGGNTALVLARYWPDRVHRMVAISANYNPFGPTPEAPLDSGPLWHWVTRWWTGAGAKTRELEGRVKRLWLTGPRLTADDLRAIRTPTLVIAGSLDVIPLAHTEVMAGLLPQAELRVIVKGGHSLPITHAARIDSLIAGFLRIAAPTANPTPH